MTDLSAEGGHGAVPTTGVPAEQKPADRRRRRQRRRSARHMRLDLQGFLQPVDFAEDVLRAFKQALARRCQPHAALDAIEQQKSQFVLEDLDLPRQRRLCDAQILAGLAEILAPRDLAEVAELAQVHIRPFLMMPIFDQTDDNSILSQSKHRC